MNVKIKKVFTKPTGIIFGLKGYKLQKDEEIFFKKINPLGFILFERNCKNIPQTKSLIRELKNIISHQYPLVMVDQEGGRVSRLRKPNWNIYPPAEDFGNKAKKSLSSAKKLVFKNARKIGSELKKLGINVNCAPVLDVKHHCTHDIIGDRAFSDNPFIVSELGKSFCLGLKDTGILPVIKHIPGHGLSKVDSHNKKPFINVEVKFLLKNDFVPFMQLKNEPIAMISHIVYTKIDSSLACTSKIIIQNIIRKKIRFKGILISDDIKMKAMKGSLQNRVKNIISAGCDIVLHCNGNIKEMKEIQHVIPKLNLKSLKKLEKIKKKIKNFSFL